MRTALPTELLWRLANATPEVFAAVERTLGMTAGHGSRMEAVETEPASDEVARQLFALVNALESKTNYRKAPVIRVFYLFCVEALTRPQVAKTCRCSLALVKVRLKAIEKKLGRKPAQLRTYSDQFEHLADSLADSRARRIDRERAIEGTDAEEED